MMHFRSLTALVLGTALLAAACDTPTEYGEQRRADLIPAEKSVLVGFETRPGAAEIALIESFGGRVTRQFKYVTAVAATIPTTQESALAATAGVRFVGDNLALVPFGRKQITDWGVSKIEAPAAWSLGAKGQGVKVGIFDSGIDVDHPDLNVVGGIDLVADGNGLDDCNGHGTHVAGIVGARNNGRFTVGVAPQAQLYSMRFADCLWEGATFDKMIAGLEWAFDNGIQVINMSFGIPTPTTEDPFDPTNAALDSAYARGIVLVGASGNSAGAPAPRDNLPFVSWPASHPAVIAVGATDDNDELSGFSQFGTEQEVTAPGVNNLASYLVGLGSETALFVRTDNDRELEVIPMAFASKTSTKGLTATTIYAAGGTPVDYALQPCAGKTAVVARGGPTFGQKAEFAKDAGCAALIIHNNQPGNFNGTLSATGETVDSKGRPWLPVVSTTLDDGLYLKNEIESKPLTTTSLFNVSGNLQILSGTSMASPHAAGVAALILGKFPGMSNVDVRNKLRSSADDLGQTGWDPIYGHGRINAKRAVQ